MKGCGQKSSFNEDKFSWKTVQEILIWFYKDFSSIGGISQSRLTDVALSKVVWILLYFVGVVCTWLNIAQIISSYLENDITTTFSQEWEQNN